MRKGPALLPVLLLAMAPVPGVPAAEGGTDAALPTGEDARPHGPLIADRSEVSLPPQSLASISAADVYRSLPPGALPLSSRFGWRCDPIDGSVRFHAGVDIPARAGAAVRAFRAGRVVFAGWSGGYGNLVVIDHGSGVTSRYGHLKRAFVTPGEPVGTGDRIGEIGSTGRSTGPHLHYEVRRGGVAIDPVRAVMPVSAGNAPDLSWPRIDPEPPEVAPRLSWTSDGGADVLPTPAIR
ncbi:M23 family metallopeptidase [Novosphingobium jiangmenense]|uniref:M23 family metallopeptidase n=1 Tax=Novosphingobium jiangmenense TaxID=2791981 RepID=A0ABS0HLD8_9SPHN|nr:M23 family metallopeptidase [Novosphingobium jiangmenense]MBF9153071.1 M23 family metallopeptidase [Novosphingobium jiangmenense]